MENRTDHIIKCRNPVRSLKVFFKTPKKWLYNELYSPHKKNNLPQKKYLKLLNNYVSHFQGMQYMSEN